MRTLHFGDWEFDHITYDADADVAYLSIGPPRRAIGEETPEGHIVRFDEQTGEFCGLTLIGIQRMLNGGMTPVVTMPRAPEPRTPEQIDTQTLGELVCA